MKPRISPIDRERVMPDDDFSVSKTDTSGRISCANRVFMAFAGDTEPELLARQHNIVRHPDMPRALFHLMWSSLQSGREFFGYVKNRAGDGSFYWTFANVTPTFRETEDFSDALLRLLGGLAEEKQRFEKPRESGGDIDLVR
jgi:hypothetical protein